MHPTVLDLSRMYAVDSNGNQWPPPIEIKLSPRTALIPQPMGPSPPLSPMIRDLMLNDKHRALTMQWWWDSRDPIGLAWRLGVGRQWFSFDRVEDAKWLPPHYYDVEPMQLVKSVTCQGRTNFPCKCDGVWVWVEEDPPTPEKKMWNVSFRSIRHILCPISPICPAIRLGLDSWWGRPHQEPTTLTLSCSDRAFFTNLLRLPGSHEYERRQKEKKKKKKWRLTPTHYL